MRFFRREASTPVDFWGWWSANADRLAQAIDAGSMDRGLIDEITRAVHAIHPQMAWELAPGATARHAFCISPEGRADLRQVALRWLATTPAADATWEFHASRQPGASLASLEVGGNRFDLSDMRAITSWDPSRRRLNVRLWHPGFERAPEQVRLQLGFLFLDNLLGEDEVERWIGQIDFLEAPTGGRTPEELLAEIGRRTTEAADDEDTWILGQLNGPDGAAIVLANAALKRIDHPFADKHVSIGVVLDDGGLPDDALAAELNREEDDLVARFGDVAVYAGRTTGPGMRTMHFAAEDLDRVRAVIDVWAQDLPPRRIKVNFADDMDWLFRRDLGIG